MQHWSLKTKFHVGTCGQKSLWKVENHNKPGAYFLEPLRGAAIPLTSSFLPGWSYRNSTPKITAFQWEIWQYRRRICIEGRASESNLRLWRPPWLHWLSRLFRALLKSSECGSRHLSFVSKRRPLVFVFPHQCLCFPAFFWPSHAISRTTHWALWVKFWSSWKNKEVFIKH